MWCWQKAEKMIHVIIMVITKKRQEGWWGWWKECWQKLTVNSIKRLWVNMKKKMRANCINFLELNAMFMISIWGLCKASDQTIFVQSSRSDKENLNVGQSDFTRSWLQSWWCWSWRWSQFEACAKYQLRQECRRECECRPVWFFHQRLGWLQLWWSWSIMMKLINNQKRNQRLE